MVSKSYGLHFTETKSRYIATLYDGRDVLVFTSRYDESSRHRLRVEIIETLKLSKHDAIIFANGFAFAKTITHQGAYVKTAARHADFIKVVAHHGEGRITVDEPSERSSLLLYDVARAVTHQVLSDLRIAADALLRDQKLVQSKKVALALELAPRTANIYTDASVAPNAKEGWIGWVKEQESVVDISLISKAKEVESTR